jgi:hypothetical protein
VALSRSRKVAAIGLLAALACGAGSRVTLASELDEVASRAATIDVNGPVLLRHGVSDFVLAQVGDVVAAGDTVRIGVGASAQITYFDGSSVSFEGGSEIVVTSPRADGGVVQALGRAWYVITQLISGSSRYEVRGPSSTASVRG